MSDFVIDSAAALARARAAVGQRFTPQGMCLYHNDIWHLNGRESIGPGHGHFATAMDGWNYAEHKHPGDRNPPVGAPVYFGPSPTRTDKNKSAGDVAFHEGGGVLICTDASGAYVGRMTIAQREVETQRPYLGWTEDFLGYMTSAGLAHRAAATASVATAAAPVYTPTKDDMSKMRLIRNTKTGSIDAFCVETGFWWHTPNMDYVHAFQNAYGIESWEEAPDNWWNFWKQLTTGQRGAIGSAAASSTWAYALTGYNGKHKAGDRLSGIDAKADSLSATVIEKVAQRVLALVKG